MHKVRINQDFTGKLPSWGGRNVHLRAGDTHGLAQGDIDLLPSGSYEIIRPQAEAEVPKLAPARFLKTKSLAKQAETNKE